MNVYITYICSFIAAFVCAAHDCIVAVGRYCAKDVVRDDAIPI